MTTQQIIAAVFATVMLGWQFWPGLSSLAGKVRLPSMPMIAPIQPAKQDQDLVDLVALKQVQERFARLKCKEGQAACLICFEHFFSEHTA